MECILSKLPKPSIGSCLGSRNKSQDNIIRLAQLEISAISNGKYIGRVPPNIGTKDFEQGLQGTPAQ